MKKSPLCGLSAVGPEKGPWRCHNEGPQQTLADFFLSKAVIHISPQPSKNSLSPLRPLASPSLSSKINPFWQSQSPKHKVFFESYPVFFLLLSLTSALRDFKLQGSFSNSHGRKLNTTGDETVSRLLRTDRQHWT